MSKRPLIDLYHIKVRELEVNLHYVDNKLIRTHLVHDRNKEAVLNNDIFAERDLRVAGMNFEEILQQLKKILRYGGVWCKVFDLAYSLTLPI